LTLEKQEEWETYFEEGKNTMIDLKQEINQLENEIDKMVYAIYDLTDEDIEIIEKELIISNKINTLNYFWLLQFCLQFELIYDLLELFEIRYFTIFISSMYYSNSH